MLNSSKITPFEQTTMPYSGSKLETNAAPQIHESASHQKTGEPVRQISEAEMATAVDTLNEHLSKQNRKVQFNFDRDTHQLVAMLVDTATNEVLSQVPSAQVLRMAKAIQSGSQGIISIHA